MMTDARLLHRVTAVALVCVVSAGACGAVAHAMPRHAAEAAALRAGQGWVWPLTGFRIERPYQAPAKPFGPGHRGIDLRPLHTGQVRAPADGVVAFAGMVAGRGVVTIDHGGGLVSTLEPVDAGVTAGTAVKAADEIGDLAMGGDAAPGTLHFGVRLAGAYINPLLLLGGIPRAVLLPCCA